MYEQLSAKSLSRGHVGNYMAGDCASSKTQLISKAGAVLRKLTPPRIATLLLVREDIGTQREIAERLDRAPPTISNYIEALESLPVPLLTDNGSDHQTTSEGDQVVSAIFRFTSNHLEMDLQEESWCGNSSAERLDKLDSCLTPLHTFRSDPPFFILYAMGTASSSGWMVDLTREPVPIRTVVADVNDWLDDSITRKQIRSRLNVFEASNVVGIDGQEVTLTGKGLEQCRLLDQVMQMFLNPTAPETSDARVTVMYQAADGTALPIPSSITPAELEQLATRFNREHDDDLDFELVTQTRIGSND